MCVVLDVVIRVWNSDRLPTLTTQLFFSVDSLRHVHDEFIVGLIIRALTEATKKEFMSMQGYRKILIALELNSECDQVLLAKAEHIASQEKASLYLIHAVEHMSNYGAAYGVSAGVDIEETLVKEANQSMSELAIKTPVAASHRLVKVGPAKFLILEEAEKLGVDLIIVGSHGRHGVRLLLGSTANAVLHGAKCDVLAVRVK